MRYVWFLVAISMVFVLAIWVFSMKAQIKQAPAVINPAQDLGGAMEQFNQQKDSLKDTIGNMQSLGQNQAAPDSQQQNLNNNQ